MVIQPKINCDKFSCSQTELFLFLKLILSYVETIQLTFPFNSVLILIQIQINFL